MKTLLMINEVLDCASSGLSQSAAATRLHVSLSSLRRFLKKNNLNEEYGKILKSARESHSLNGDLNRLNEFKTIGEALEVVNSCAFTKNIRKLYALGEILGGTCKKCSGVNDYGYGIGVFCSEVCARGYSTMNMTKEAKERRKSKLKKLNESHEHDESGEDKLDTKVEDYLPIVNRTNSEISGLIYRHISPSGKSYIGQTIRKSWQERAGREPLKAYPAKKFNNAILKYGWENFAHEILEDNITDRKILNEREAYWIEYYDSVNNGYNYVSGHYDQVSYTRKIKDLMELIPRDTLIELYINGGKTLREIGKIYEVSHPLIINLMNLYKIERRNFNELGNTVLGIREEQKGEYVYTCKVCGKDFVSNDKGDKTSSTCSRSCRGKLASYNYKVSHKLSIDLNDPYLLNGGGVDSTFEVVKKEYFKRYPNNSVRQWSGFVSSHKKSHAAKGIFNGNCLYCSLEKNLVK